uniref:Small G protein signaling modulator 2 n=1 Tax=Equus caballus TaxID=9796 RepID=A0A9L0SCS9_HORSE
HPPAPGSGKGPGQLPDVCAGLGKWLRSRAPGSGGGGGGRGAPRAGAPPCAWGAEPRGAEEARARWGLGAARRRLPATRRTMGSAEDAVKEKLLWNVKKEVKQIMEEAVTRKFVHEDSSHIIALCVHRWC